MNYRHAFHAGNFADVLKHGLLCWIVHYLQQKEAPLCIIDTHAGRGVYDLSSPEATKTSEAGQGILKVLQQDDIPPPLSPYVQMVRKHAAGTYPGSPLLLAKMARQRDRIMSCELHPQEAEALRLATTGTPQMRVIEGDGYRKLMGLLPPAEKRGLVLIDPPFEQPDEFQAMADAFVRAHRKWPTGTYMLWFPVKDRARVARFLDELRSAQIPKLTLCHLDVARPEGLSASGVLLANAPYTLPAAWAPALDWLARTLAQGEGATSQIYDLADG
jgi:23S rRNA (adenine2030-N6)-methyltransferase